VQQKPIFAFNLVNVENTIPFWPFAALDDRNQQQQMKARIPVAEEKKSVRVEIYDESYNLCGSDSAYITHLAEVVDAKMRAVAQHTSTVDSLRVAVLAALNLADDYYQLKRKYEGMEGEYTSRASHLGRALDSALDELLAEVRRAG